MIFSLKLECRIHSNRSKNDMQDGMRRLASKRNIWTSEDGFKSFQNAPKTPPRRPPGPPRRPQDDPKTPPKRPPMPSQEPLCFQEAPGCPSDAPGAPSESLREAPSLDFGWILNRCWEGKWKQVGSKMRSEPKTRTQLRRGNKSQAVTAKARLILPLSLLARLPSSITSKPRI